MPTVPPTPPAFPNATPQQLARKARSEARLGREARPPPRAPEAHLLAQSGYDARNSVSVTADVGCLVSNRMRVR